MQANVKRGHLREEPRHINTQFEGFNELLKQAYIRSKMLHVRQTKYRQRLLVQCLHTATVKFR